MKLSKLDHEIISTILKNNKIKLKHVNLKQCGGTADEEKRTIYISRHIKNKGKYLSAVFHEIGHIFCYDTGTYPIYHHKLNVEMEKIKKVMKLTAWRAEKYVDEWATL